MKTYGISAYIGMVGCVVCLSAVADAGSGNNLVRNGSFETTPKSPGGVPCGWSAYPTGGLKPNELWADTENVKVGRAALRFRDARHCLSQTVRVHPGEVYTVGGFIKTRLKKGGAGLAVAWIDQKGKWVFDNATRLQVMHNANLYGLNDWRKCEAGNLVVPQSAVFAWIAVQPFNECVGDFWVDDLVMEKTPAGTSGQAYRTRAQIARTATAPVLDGVLDDAAWKNTTELGRFSVPKMKVLARQPTTARLTYDDRAIYLGIECRDSKTGSLINEATTRDGAVWSDDCVELFIDPAGDGKNHYHLAVNPRGSQYDAREQWVAMAKNVSSNLGWNGSWSVATKIGEQSWTAEIQIPFSMLAVSAPAEGSQWRINITRHRGIGNEYSSWSSLPDLTFQKPSGFGEIEFGGIVPVIQSYGIQNGRIDVCVSNPTDSAITGQVKLECLSQNRYWLLDNLTVAIDPTSQKLASLSLGKADSGEVWLTVGGQGKVLYREGYSPIGEFALLCSYDPEGIVGNALYLASGLRSFRSFQTVHNFEGTKPGQILMNRDQKAVDVVFELPEGVKATHLLRCWPNWVSWPILEPKTTSPFRREGTNFTRYVFELPGIMNLDMNTLTVFFETTWTAGKKGIGYCYLKWDTGRQPPRALDIDVIQIDPMGPFKRFVNGIYYAEGEFLLTWFPEGLATLYPRYGFNRLEIDPAPPAWRSVWCDRLVAEGKKGKLFMATAPSQTTPWFQNWTKNDPTAREIDVRGKPVYDGRWADTYGICPLYTGKYFQEHLGKILNGPAFQKHRLSWLALDLELWSDESWNAGCFCPRCLTAFRKFASERYPKETFDAPNVFMVHPEKHPRQAKAWTAFRNWTLGQMVRNICDPIARQVKICTDFTGPKPRLVVSEWRNPEAELLECVDYFEINLYRKPQAVADRLEEALKLANGRKVLMGTPTSGQTCGLDTNIEIPDIRYSIYECAAAGVQGMIWYEIMGFDMLKFKTMVDGLRIIQPFEDLILEGRCEVSIPCQGRYASSRGVVRDDEALVVVRAYDGPREVTAAIPWPCRGTAVAKDCRTGETLATITPDENRIAVKLSDERARLLYIGPEQKWKQRTGR